jgi:hypothetical protein|uniref:Uncharacterized protein n=1 Tax=viral metagenome TaxID=1070528 RepID=A0A6C0ILU6_9ZZZZ
MANSRRQIYNQYVTFFVSYLYNNWKNNGCIKTLTIMFVNYKKISKYIMDCEEDNLICPLYCSQYIWYICWLSIVSGVYAIHKNHYFLSIIPFGVFILGINYWKNPESNCLRRYIDIMFVFVSIIINTYVSFYAENGKSHNLFNILALMCYPTNWLLFTNGYLKTSTFLHICLHIFANIALYFLYSGDINYSKLYL